jgi:formylglycine-generating enzyme required for sulfatase activity
VARAVDKPLSRREISFCLARDVRLELAFISAGEFLMGSANSDRDADDNAKPQHRVRIKRAFYLAKYPVTQVQWQAVMGCDASPLDMPNNPICQVSWHDCQRFLQKLNADIAAGLGRFALPSEAQWEYSCRAGGTGHYCFGDKPEKLPEFAWYSANYSRKTHAVGGKKANAWGLYDMHGNVMEWCQDWYGDGAYKASSADDPQGPSKGTHRVLRGGCWYYPAAGCRSAHRYYAEPGDRLDFLGFRVALIPVDK